MSSLLDTVKNYTRKFKNAQIFSFENNICKVAVVLTKKCTPGIINALTHKINFWYIWAALFIDICVNIRDS